MDVAKEFETDHIEGWHLWGKKDVILTITGAEKGYLPNFKTGKNDSKILVKFKESPKTLPLNKTNLKMLVMLMGSTDTDKWIGKQIALYCEHVRVGGQMRLGVRIRDELPKPKNGKNGGKAPSASMPMSEAQAVQAAMMDEPPPNWDPENAATLNG